MRIAVHSSLGTFVSRILSEDEFDTCMERILFEHPLTMEAQDGSEYEIPHCVYSVSVLQYIDDAAIAALPQAKG